jgi:hypothetical protein
MNPQFDLVMSLLNVPKYAPHAWPHLTQRSRAATDSRGSCEYSDSVLLKSLVSSNNIQVIAGINARMENMLSERGKILVIFENFKFRNCGSTEKGVV